MNHIKKIGLLLTILMIEQVNIASSFRFKTGLQPSAHTDPTSVADIDAFEQQSVKSASKSTSSSDADNFIQESYIFPAQQVAICNLFGKPFAINTLTSQPILLGKDNQPRSWPTVTDIIRKANNNGRDAVFAAKQAIEIAIENARLTFGLQADANSKQEIKQSETQVMQDLAAKKQIVDQALARQRGNTIPENFDVDSIESITSKLQDAGITVYTTHEVENNLLADNNNFKHLVATNKIPQAAELLFRQCYVAQQGQQLNEHQKMGTLISDARLAKSAQKIHQKLTAIARAVKTAVYIAQNEYGKSWYNPTAYIPVYSSYTTHPLISKLQEMDELVRKDLINPKYGATQADINRQYYLDLATGIAKGIVITAAVAGTLAVGAYAYNNKDALYVQAENAGAAVLNAPGQLYNATTTQIGKATTAVSNTMSGFMPKGRTEAELLEARIEAEKEKRKEAERVAAINKYLNPTKAAAAQIDAESQAKNLKIDQARFAAAQQKEKLAEEQVALEKLKTDFDGGVVDIMKLKWQQRAVESAAQDVAKAQEKVKELQTPNLNTSIPQSASSKSWWNNSPGTQAIPLQEVTQADYFSGPSVLG